MKITEKDIGMRVWSFRYGWGQIVKLYFSYDKYPVSVRFDSGGKHIYTSDGCYSIEQSQDLFWDKINFDVPGRPKKKVKKTKEYWANVYENKTPRLHKSNSLALGCKSKDCIDTVKVLVEYEEYEEGEE